MKKISAKAFNSRCLEIIEEIHDSGEPVVITRRGKPVVRIEPMKMQKGNLIGFMKGKIKIVGDIESPIPDWQT
jgi:prevent-host-death family protein